MRPHSHARAPGPFFMLYFEVNRFNDGDSGEARLIFRIAGLSGIAHSRRGADTLDIEPSAFLDQST